MKRFESFLAPQLEQYTTYRQTLVYVDETLQTRLRTFDRYVKEKAVDQRSLNPLFFLALRKKLRGEAKTVNSVLSTARGFFQFLIRQGLLPENAYIPFVFSPDEVERLLLAIRKNIRNNLKYFFKDLSVYMTILLLARCGLRISEPLRLLLTHYRHKEKTIYIKNTKFSKDRLVPVPYSTAREIENYLAVRHTLQDNDRNPFLLAGQDQNPLSANRIYTEKRTQEQQI